MTTLTLPNLEALHHTAQTLLDLAQGHRIFAFYAPMGTGKTTFITALCEVLGIKDVINSPTFAIVNEYALPHAQPEEVAYHMDCYRLDKLEDALNVGFADYLSQGRYCFIEWPEVIEALLPEDTVRIKMYEGEHGERIIECNL